MATSYFGFKPIHNIIDEKLRMQLDVIRDTAAIAVQKHAKRFVTQIRNARRREYVLPARVCAVLRAALQRFGRLLAGLLG